MLNKFNTNYFRIEKKKTKHIVILRLFQQNVYFARRVTKEIYRQDDHFYFDNQIEWASHNLHIHISAETFLSRFGFSVDWNFFKEYYFK